MAFCELTRLLRQIARRAHIARQVAQVAQQRLACSNGITLHETAARSSLRRRRQAGETEASQRRPRRLARGLEIIGAIQRAAGEIGHGATEVVVAHRIGFWLVDGQRQMCSASPQGGGQCSTDGLAPAPLRKILALAEPHYQQPLRLDAGGLHQQLRVTQPQGQVAAGLELAQQSACGGVDLPGGSGEGVFVEQAYGEAVGGERADALAGGVESNHGVLRAPRRLAACVMG